MLPQSPDVPRSPCRSSCCPGSPAKPTHLRQAPSSVSIFDLAASAAEALRPARLRRQAAAARARAAKDKKHARDAALRVAPLAPLVSSLLESIRLSTRPPVPPLGDVVGCSGSRRAACGLVTSL
eukprot:15476926-Alexandrium_andersonii.AAC.2